MNGIRKYICGFAAVNGGKHCIINGHCVVCKVTESIQ